MTDFSTLTGLTLSRVEKNADGDELLIVTTDGRVFKQRHHQDCCESVLIESVVGDLDDLIDSPILLAEETSNSEVSDDYESSTWTFYKLATIKGSVTIRWLGSSNGYYSESVDFDEVWP